MEVKIFQLPKREAVTYDKIQDRYAVSGNCIAIADGATQSFKSEIWADLLVRKFLDTPELTKQTFQKFVQEAGLEFNARKFEPSPDPMIALLERDSKVRGGYATFVGARINKLRMEVSFIAYGDCLIAIEKRGRLSFIPFSTPDELRSNKGFLSSREPNSASFNEEYVVCATLSFDEDTRFYLATDAMAIYLLKNRTAIHDVASCQTFDEFKQYIIDRWDRREIEEDDITLACIQPSKASTISECIPPHAFRFTSNGEREADFLAGPPRPAAGHLAEKKAHDQEQTIGKVERVNKKEMSRSNRKNYLARFALLLIFLFALFVIVRFLYAKKQRADMENGRFPAKQGITTKKAVDGNQQ